MRRKGRMPVHDGEGFIQVQRKIEGIEEVISKV